MHFAFILHHDLSQDSPQLRCHSPLLGFCVWKTCPLTLGKREIKSHDARSGEYGARQCFSQPGTARCSGCSELAHCCGETTTSCFEKTLTSSRALNEVNATGSVCTHAG